MTTAEGHDETLAMQWIELTANDGHKLQAYVARPAAPRTAVVIVQEIFGVNHHIRSVVEDYAREGFLAVAPALFDRVSRGLELAYDAASIAEGARMAHSLGIDPPLQDVAAALDYAGLKVGAAHVGVVGYCWGGTLAWLAATRLAPGAAVGYYGGNIAEYAAEKPKSPVLLHFGLRDQHIPPSAIAKIRQHHPGLHIETYDAPHGFNCAERAEYTPDAAKLARERTLDFLRKQLEIGRMA